MANGSKQNDESIRQSLDEMAAREYVRIRREERRRKEVVKSDQEDEYDSWFTRWSRDGRITFLVWLITTVMWGIFSLVLKEAPPALNQVWILISGLLVGHLTMARETKKKRK